MNVKHLKEILAALPDSYDFCSTHGDVTYILRFGGLVLMADEASRNLDFRRFDLQDEDEPDEVLWSPGCATH